MIRREPPCDYAAEETDGQGQSNAMGLILVMAGNGLLFLCIGVLIGWAIFA